MWDAVILNKKSNKPGDFVTNMKQINSQSDLTSMSSFASPSYLTVRKFQMKQMVVLSTTEAFTSSRFNLWDYFRIMHKGMC